MQIRSSYWRCFVKKRVLENFSKFTGKHLCQGLFFNKVAGLRIFSDILDRARSYLSCFNGQIFTRSWDENPRSFPIDACLTHLDENLDVGATKNKIWMTKPWYCISWYLIKPHNAITIVIQRWSTKLVCFGSA